MIGQGIISWKIGRIRNIFAWCPLHFPHAHVEATVCPSRINGSQGNGHGVVGGSCNVVVVVAGIIRYKHDIFMRIDIEAQVVIPTRSHLPCTVVMVVVVMVLWSRRFP